MKFKNIFNYLKISKINYIHCINLEIIAFP